MGRLAKRRGNPTDFQGMLLDETIFQSNIICSEEAIVMANLRKRVAACDLERRPAVNDTRTNEANQDELDNRPLLSKVRPHLIAQFHYALLLPITFRIN